MTAATAPCSVESNTAANSAPPFREEVAPERPADSTIEEWLAGRKRTRVAKALDGRKRGAS